MPSVAKSGEADPRALANNAWAFAPLLVMDSQLLQAIAAAALKKCSQFYGQGISNTSWSVARLCLLDGTLIAALAA